MPRDPLALAEVRRLCDIGVARTLRHRSGLSLREMAAHVGVSASTLLAWENGSQKPTARTSEQSLRYLELLHQIADVPSYADRSRGAVPRA